MNYKRPLKLDKFLTIIAETKQESRAVAGKPRDAAVNFQDDGIWSNRKYSAIRSADPENPT